MLEVFKCEVLVCGSRGEGRGKWWGGVCTPGTLEGDAQSSSHVMQAQLK